MLRRSRKLRAGQYLGFGRCRHLDRRARLRVITTGRIGRSGGSVGRRRPHTGSSVAERSETCENGYSYWNDGN